MCYSKAAQRACLQDTMAPDTPQCSLVMGLQSWIQFVQVAMPKVIHSDSIMGGNHIDLLGKALKHLIMQHAASSDE